MGNGPGSADGAEVVLRATRHRAVSGGDGRFVLADVPAEPSAVLAFLGLAD
jgi:hypothetical protein